MLKTFTKNLFAGVAAAMLMTTAASAETTL